MRSNNVIDSDDVFKQYCNHLKGAQASAMRRFDCDGNHVLLHSVVLNGKCYSHIHEKYLASPQGLKLRREAIIHAAWRWPITCAQYEVMSWHFRNIVFFILGFAALMHPGLISSILFVASVHYIFKLPYHGSPTGNQELLRPSFSWWSLIPLGVLACVTVMLPSSAVFIWCVCLACLAVVNYVCCTTWHASCALNAFQFQGEAAFGQQALLSGDRFTFAQYQYHQDEDITALASTLRHEVEQYLKKASTQVKHRVKQTALHSESNIKLSDKEANWVVQAVEDEQFNHNDKSEPKITLILQNASDGYNQYYDEYLAMCPKFSQPLLQGCGAPMSAAC